MSENVNIDARDFWFKIVSMCQQNWALVKQLKSDVFTVYFIQDASGVFDKIDFCSLLDAEAALPKNGFVKYIDDLESQKFISPPNPPFRLVRHPNGPIYSSGKYWV